MTPLTTHVCEPDPVGNLERGIVEREGVLVTAVHGPETGALDLSGAERKEVARPFGDLSGRPIVALCLVDVPACLRDVRDRRMRIGEMSEVAALVCELE